MKFLLACDKFKGSVSASEVGEAIAHGIAHHDICDQCPITDGGDGFAKIISDASRGAWVYSQAKDPLGKSIMTRYVVTGDTAVIEMSEVAGLRRIKELDVLNANTFGVGQLIRNAANDPKVKKIIIGLGGSATNDGGIGMAVALGAKLLDKDGNELEPKVTELAKLDRVDGSGIGELPPIMAACDVTNPLLGDNGATAIYGPQKGATKEDQVILEAALAKLAACTDWAGLATKPGSGAAGGLGYGLMAFADAKLVPGFDLFAETVKLKSRIEAADVVITGEGSLDAQSFNGKGPIGVAQMAKEAGKKVIVVCGRIDEDLKDNELFDAVYTVRDQYETDEESIQNAGKILQKFGQEIYDNFG
ncbi:glycerate kinase [Persicirhabdus sediminis]|uniref:Glycerate kinase n=1 Tax=Persicirhabdus sediminis TaxID=454144 RepID=A0A8J7MGW9_9BACT|nr:glycerate kinase [Persicirhabdus sediminis]MBK1791614.1 glycerate kinase [Persicirhabdus sediminis]